MIDALSVIKEYDMIFFTPAEEDDETQVLSATYKNPGEKVKPGLAGDIFHIVLFRLNEMESENLVTDLEHFEGVLIEPKTYVSRMIKDNWYGVVARKTSTSQTLIEDVVADWSKM